MINNPLAQASSFAGGPIAPTTVAAAISAAASYSNPAALTSSMSIEYELYFLNLFLVISTIINPTTAISNPISHPTVVNSPGMRSK
jgi:hypothetical protein